MLWNRAWEKTPTIEGFIRWLERQKPTDTYEYEWCDRCVIGKYFASLGIEYHLDFVAGKWEDKIAVPEPHTLGAALHRALEFAAVQKILA